MDIELIAIFIILSLALFLAIFQFLKTPKEKRYIFFTEDKNVSDPSYAPEYTKQERINLALKHGSWILPLFIVIQYYFFPWLKNYASHANCYTYGNGYINGIHLLFYGLFVFMPLSFAIAVFIMEGKRSIKVLKIGQNPLPSEKVLRPTKYKYGVTAKIKPLIVLIIIICFIFTSVWGGFTAYNMTKIIKPCTANKSLQLTNNTPLRSVLWSTEFKR